MTAYMWARSGQHSPNKKKKKNLFFFIRKAGVVLPLKNLLNPYRQVKYFFKLSENGDREIFVDREFSGRRTPKFFVAYGL